MRISRSTPGPAGRAFTLIEMLVVISIIAVLAALLLPVLAKARQAAKVQSARSDITTLAAAAHQYLATYSKWPASRKAWNCAGNNLTSWDFTFGTTRPDGSLLNSTYPIIASYALDDVPAPDQYQNNNSEVVSVVMDLERFTDGAPTVNLGHARNPRRHSYLTLRQARTSSSPGFGPDGVYRDPWGNPYIVSFDMNFDNTTYDGFYSTLRKYKSKTLPPALRLHSELPQRILVWSFGPDGKVDDDWNTGMNDPNNASKGTGANKDNILSWE